MIAKCEECIADPDEFIRNMPNLAAAFRARMGVEYPTVQQLRSIVQNHSSLFETDTEACRELLGEFACMLNDWYAFRVKATGLLRRRCTATSLRTRERHELVELFKMCILEGHDFAPPGEMLGSPGKPWWYP